MSGALPNSVSTEAPLRTFGKTRIRKCAAWI